MAPAKPLSVSIRFESERFDYRSELPQAFNAGNRFYGRDLAVYLVEQLKTCGFQTDFMDEDWGWLVSSIPGQTPILEIAIYNLAEHEGASERGIPQWGLWIQAHERHKWLGLLPKMQAVAVPANVREAIESAVRAAGAIPRPWEDGPGGR